MAVQNRWFSTGALLPFDPPRPFKVTEHPNPGWKLRDGLSETPLASKWKEDAEQGWKTWKMAEMSSRESYQLLTSAIIPRPIAFVSTLSASGVPNLAPFSYFSMVGHDPPMVSISLSLSPRRPKDTRENILATKEFVVNLISEPFVEAANSTSVEAPAEVDEWDVSGLTRAPSEHVKPPRVKESAVSLECELYFHHDICPDSSTVPSTTVVLGRVTHAHVRHAVLQSDGLQVDPAKFGVVSRLGGNLFARVGEAFDIKRPPWKEIEQELKGQVG